MTPSPFVAGLRLRCPQCGKGEVFEGYLKFRDHCRACGADFKSADAGDGPAVFVILIVLQFGLDLPGWLALGLTMAAAVALCLALLPPFKAVLFALQWKHKAREATSDDVR